MTTSLRTIFRRVPFARAIANQLGIIQTDKYQDRIASKAHNEVELSCGNFKIPPIRLRDMVRRGAILAEDFILEGRQVYQVLNDIADESNDPIRNDARLFEFGVGCGRVARHFIHNGAQCFVGSDIDSELVEWCNYNLRIGEEIRFFKNNFQPPLSVERESFDFAYSISVFTHMDVESQRSWAKEMGRVVKPGGRLMLSFLERPSSSIPSGVEVNERIDREYNRTWLGESGAPLVYFNTYNSKEYLSEMFAENFQLLTHHVKAVRNHQSILVFRRK